MFPPQKFRKSLGGLEKAVETRPRGWCSHSIFCYFEVPCTRVLKVDRNTQNVKLSFKSYYGHQFLQRKEIKMKELRAQCKDTKSTDQLTLKTS